MPWRWVYVRHRALCSLALLRTLGRAFLASEVQRVEVVRCVENTSCCDDRGRIVSVLAWLLVVILVCAVAAIAFMAIRRTRRSGAVLAAHVDRGPKT